MKEVFVCLQGNAAKENEKNVKPCSYSEKNKKFLK